MTRQPIIKRAGELEQSDTHGSHPLAQLDDVETADTTLNLADEGLVFAEQRCELLLRQPGALPRTSKLVEEMLVFG